MKRLNPTTGLPFIHGDTREDGFVFIAYRRTRPLRKNGEYQEKWVSPQVFTNTKKTSQNASAKHQAKKMQTLEGHVALILSGVKSRAIKNNLPFNITQEHLMSIMVSKCPVFLIELGWCQRNKTPQQHSPSLDKIDPSKGYVVGNVQWLSYKANTMKNDASPSELKQFSEWVLQLPL